MVGAVGAVGGLMTDFTWKIYKNYGPFGNLKVNDPIPDPPTITQQPASLTVEVGTQAQFTVSATGGSLRYQWTGGGVPISDGGTVSVENGG